MLKRLELHQVGPAHDLGPVELAERVNVLTGDNGLGKTLFLDVAWWALTGNWLGRPALPREDAIPDDPPTLSATVAGKVREAQVRGDWSFDQQEWIHPGGRPPMPGLVLFFRVDGRFSVWDPAQHYWRRNKVLEIDDPNRPAALHFAPGEAWDTIRSSDGKPICRGLIEDWVTWQQTKSPEFEVLCQVLEALSPSPEERLVPGEPTRVWLDDVRLFPTLDLPYGRTPVTLASAGVQRVVLLAYLLVWAWRDHFTVTAIRRQEAEQRFVLLFDEPETHLHPQWQRRIIPALLRAIEFIQPDMEVQLLVSTHSPLVLASLEPSFDPSRDRLLHFHLDRPERQAVVEEVPFTARGDVLNWLVSPIFGLQQGRSVPAEEAVEAAERFMRGEGDKNPEGLQSQDEIDSKLRSLLGDRDPFWPRWLVRTGQVDQS